MYEIIQLIFDLCVFKKNPQDLPYSSALLKLMMAANCLAGFLILSVRGDLLPASFQAVFGLALNLGFCYLALAAGKKIARFNQTTSALLGADTLISFFALPALATLTVVPDQPLVFLVLTLLLLWHWLILGHILKHALDTHYLFGLGVAFLFLVASYQLNAALFPPPAS